jgi:hypothetical protein
MYLAVNKHNTQEIHSFHWTPDNKLIICGLAVNPNDWEIIEMEKVSIIPQKKKEEPKINQLVTIFLNGDWDTSHEDKGDTSPVRIFDKGEVYKILASDYDQYIDDLEERGYDCYLCLEMYAHPQWNGEIIFMKEVE